MTQKPPAYRGAPFLAAALAGALACAVSCAGDSGSPEPAGNGAGTDDGTRLVFDNSRGICDAVVYTSSQREGAILARVPAGASSAALPYHAAPDGTTFYFSYPLTLRGFDAIPFDVIPARGRDQTVVRVDAGKTTTARIPPLDEALGALDERLSAKSYVVIKNDSSYAFSLLKGSSRLTPAGGAASSTVNAGEEPYYILDNAEASAFAVSCGGNDVRFPPLSGAFEGGVVYRFTFTGAALTARQAVTLILPHMALVTEGVLDNSNGPFLFSAWNDAGGENRVFFGRKQAFLAGPFWLDSAGTSLDSEYRAASSSIVVWTNKAVNKGIPFTVDGAALSVNASDGTTRSFLRN